MAQQAPQYAGFWIRFVAMIIDSIIMLVLFITIIGWLIYLPLMWAWKGQTVGQMITNVKIVRAVDGGPISAGTAIIRYIVFLLEGAFTIGLLGFIWAAFDSKKQAWHDKAAGTVVIR